jgi:hypothetical protein
MEREGSLSCSQQPATGPHPEPDTSTPYLSTLFPYDSPKYFISIYA